MEEETRSTLPELARPICPECSKRMELVLVYGSEEDALFWDCACLSKRFDDGTVPDREEELK